jgi:peptidoglycan/LPS O-acetylase OafA/YrhL
MSNQGERMSKGNRLYWLDNLRTFIIFLVVLYHAGGVYESSGFWASFWIVDDPATNDLVGILNLIIDIFVMPTMFFISGYLIPMSLKNKNGWAFLKSRFKRLFYTLEICLKKVGLPTFTGATEFGIKIGYGFCLFCFCSTSSICFFLKQISGSQIFH